MVRAPGFGIRFCVTFAAKSVVMLDSTRTKPNTTQNCHSTTPLALQSGIFICAGLMYECLNIDCHDFSVLRV